VRLRADACKGAVDMRARAGGRRRDASYHALAVGPFFPRWRREFETRFASRAKTLPLLVLDRRTDGRGKPKPRRNKQTGPVRESEANMDLLFRSLRKEKKIDSC
jgi:hypothetical protein